MLSIKKWSRALALALALAIASPSVTPQTSITAEAASLKISHTKKTLKVGKSLKLKITGNGKTKVTWKSSKKSVASVSSTGKVTAKKAGKAKITATIGTKTKTCAITVEKINPNIKKAPFTAVEKKIKGTDFSVAIPKGWESGQTSPANGYNILQIAETKPKETASANMISLALIEQPNFVEIPDYETIAKPFFQQSVTENAIKQQLEALGVSDVTITDTKQSDVKTTSGMAYLCTMHVSYTSNGTKTEEDLSFYYMFIEGYLVQVGIDDFGKTTTPDTKTVAEYLLDSLYKIK